MACVLDSWPARYLLCHKATVEYVSEVSPL